MSFIKRLIDFFFCADARGHPKRVSERHIMSLQIWQRPTLPRLKTKYHRRRGVSRPSSEWDRVQPPRHNHQVSKVHVNIEKLVFPSCSFVFRVINLFGRSPQGRLAAGACAPRLPQRRPVGRNKREGNQNPILALPRWVLAMRTIKSIELLVPVSYMRCRTSTPGLSTWSSSTALREYSF